ncbi:uncharacterized protein METZ01_LOCUS438795, partial [marine metagenome]
VSQTEPRSAILVDYDVIEVPETPTSVEATISRGVKRVTPP